MIQPLTFFVGLISPSFSTTTCGVDRCSLSLSLSFSIKGLDPAHLWWVTLTLSFVICFSTHPIQGVVLLVMAVPLQTWVGKQFGKLRVRTAGKTDRRIRLMNEIVNGMKVIKMYTWEKPFANLVHESREEEIGVIRNTSYYRAFNFSFFFSASRFILLCTFLVFGFTGEVINFLV